MNRVRALSMPSAEDRATVAADMGDPALADRLDWRAVRLEGVADARELAASASAAGLTAGGTGDRLVVAGPGDRLVAWAPDDLKGTIQRALTPAGPRPIEVSGRRLPFGERVLVLGILNASPDSFSDGGRLVGREAIVAHGRALAADGADIIELGGMTAQPKKPLISIDEEIERVVPVIEALRGSVDVALAVDTYRVEVARAAVGAGAVLLNDIGGLADERMATLAAGSGAALVVMHIRNRPKVDFHQPEHRWSLDYESVVDEVAAFLADRAARAVALGVPAEKVLIDPGLGFDKLYLHDVPVLRRLAELRSLGHPIYLATSRKNYLGELSRLPPAELDDATAAAVTWAVAHGADLVRVHNVRAMKRVVTVAEYLSGRRALPPLEEMALWR